MKPPPPRLPAAGWVTARAKPVATAASTALPPFARTDAPASHAGADTQTTRPSLEGVPRSACVRGAGAATSRRARTKNPRMCMMGRSPVDLAEAGHYATLSRFRRRCRRLAIAAALVFVKPVPQIQLRPHEV